VFACIGIIALATMMAFLPALDNEFVHWDDMDNWVGNVHIRSFSRENLHWMFTSSLLGVWQPLTWLLAAVQYHFFGRGEQADFSRAIHVINIGLHAVASILAFFLLRALIALAAPRRAAEHPLGLNVAAAVAALLFAVHPLRVETVAWATAQPYILAVIGCFGCVLCYLRAAATGRWLWHAAACACFAASLLCKSIGIPMVAVLLVLDCYPLRRLGASAGSSAGPVRSPQRPDHGLAPVARIRRTLLEKIPYAAIAAAAVGMALYASRAQPEYRADSAWKKSLIASHCLMFYAAVTFVPVRLAPYYMRPMAVDWRDADPWYVGAALALLIVTAATLVLRRRWPGLSAAWACYVIILLPVVGFVRHGGQMAADRYSYLSCFGWAALAGAAVLAVWNRPALRAAALLTGLTVAALLGSRTAQYCRAWHDSVSLWTAMIERNPRFHMGFYNLAKAYKRNGDLPTAEQMYRRAIELYPTYPQANVDLGNMMRAAGRPDDAERHYRDALRGRPGYHMAYMNLGYLRMSQKRTAEAIRCFELAEADAAAAGAQDRLPAIRRQLADLRAKSAAAPR